MNKVRVQVVIEQDEDGLYIADVPALQGCHTQGETFEEAMERIKEVIELCLEEMKDEGREFDTRYPEVIALKTLEIAV
jgi:predicted RNase H-like HicB family nuclease